MDSLRHPGRAYQWTAAVGAALLAGCALVSAGCSTQRPTEVMVSQVSSEIDPAKPPDCDMPVLTTQPTKPYKVVAIVDLWADIKKTKAEVVPALKRKGCATGAQALLILNAKSQDVKQLLYGATPNASETQVTTSNGSGNQAGEYIRMMEHTRRIGELGHDGFYIDAVAIDFRSNTKTADSNGQPSSP
jgi:hypothetical protein